MKHMEMKKYVVARIAAIMSTGYYEKIKPVESKSEIVRLINEVWTEMDGDLFYIVKDKVTGKIYELAAGALEYIGEDIMDVYVHIVNDAGGLEYLYMMKESED